MLDASLNLNNNYQIVETGSELENIDLQSHYKIGELYLVMLSF